MSSVTGREKGPHETRVFEGRYLQDRKKESRRATQGRCHTWKVGTQVGSAHVWPHGTLTGALCHVAQKRYVVSVAESRMESGSLPWARECPEQWYFFLKTIPQAFVPILQIRKQSQRH